MTSERNSKRLSDSEYCAWLERFILKSRSFECAIWQNGEQMYEDYQEQKRLEALPTVQQADASAADGAGDVASDCSGPTASLACILMLWGAAAIVGAVVMAVILWA